VEGNELLGAGNEARMFNFVLISYICPHLALSLYDIHVSSIIIYASIVFNNKNQEYKLSL
jgi:hypothetical protein